MINLIFNSALIKLIQNVVHIEITKLKINLPSQSHPVQLVFQQLKQPHQPESWNDETILSFSERLRKGTF